MFYAKAKTNKTFTTEPPQYLQWILLHNAYSYLHTFKVLENVHLRGPKPVLWLLFTTKAI